MKKNKNDAVNTKNITEENKNSLNGRNSPSEKGDTNNNEERELPFKKVLYGFNPDEVHSFISELTKSYDASLKLHESKLSTMKEELAFSNRERDRYIQKCKEYQTEIDRKAPPVEDKSDEYRTIAQLEETVRILKAENENLRSIQAAAPSEPSEDHKEKFLSLENRNKEIETELDSVKKTNEELLMQIEKHASISDKYESAVQELEEAKLRLSNCEKELKVKCNESEEKDAKINALNNEKNEAEKKIAELEVKNNILLKRNSESEEEISKLRETNKTIIFENAERINALENEHAKSKLAIRKELKLYGYYVDRAELTVAELTKQIEQIKQSFNNSEI